MNTERFRHVIIALGVLIFLWGLVEIFTSDFQDADGDLDIPALTEEEVDSILFAAGEGLTTLAKRSDGTWTANGSLVARGSIDEVFTMLSEPGAATLVSENPASHERMEIGDGAARRITVYGGGAVKLDLMVGKRGRSFQDVFVRMPDEDEVYSLRSRVATYVERDAEEWRDKQIANITSELVGSADVRLGRRTYRLEKGEGGWTFADGAEADSAAIARMLREYASLTALGFPSEAQRDSADFNSAERSAVIRDVAGQTLLDIAFDSIASGFLVTVQGDTTMWRLDTGKVSRMTPADSLLRR